MKRILPALLFLLAPGLTQSLFAQLRTCSTMEYLEQQIQEDPIRKANLDAIDEYTNLLLSGAARSSVTGVITIPVVVHVVYNTTAENISDAQINSQLNVLTKDFRRTNSDADGVWPQAADSEIQFCLSTIDPSGNPTTGITRTSTSTTAFSSSDNMKFNSTGGKDAWPAGSYLNIWVCDLSGGLLGYAQFPGGPASTDGVVIDYQYFGTTGTATAPFNLGRTATHEVGHWLNLRHIWGDGGCSVDDGVADTPESAAPNYGCPIGFSSCGGVNMVQNYMDYTDDACMNLYTAGQKTRMRALFDAGGARLSLLSSAGCGSAPAPTCSDGVQNGTETGIDCGGSCPPCGTGCTTNNLTLTITFDNYPEETSWTLKNSSGTTVASGGPYGSQPDGSTLTQSLCQPNGCYTFTMNDSYGDGMCCTYGSGSYTLSGPTGTLASGGTFTSSQVTNFCLGSTAPTCTDGIQNGTETGVDCGGSCPPCPTGCTYTSINSNSFESGLGIWTLGGTDARRNIADDPFANGAYCVRLRDNTTTSVVSTSSLNLSAYNKVKLDFSFITSSFDNVNEDFWLQVSTNGGTTYSTIVIWNFSEEFVNGTRYNPSVILTGTFGSTCRFRFRADASADDDQLFLDDIAISACFSAAKDGDESADFIVELDGSMMDQPVFFNQLNLYPNPTSNQLNVELDLVKEGEWQMLVSDITGKMMTSQSLNLSAGRQLMSLNTTDYAPGLYLMYLTNGQERISRKFTVNR